MPPAKKKTVKAKCPENQAAVDRLLAHREKRGANDNYGFTLKRALESVIKCPTAITTTEEALKVSYVGPHVARILLPPPKESRTKKRSKATKDASSTAAGGDTPSVGMSQQSTESAASKRPRTKAPPKPAPKPAPLTDILERPSAKEVAYQRAVTESKTWKTRIPGQLEWKVVLLVDTREPKSQHMLAKCKMSGIPCEERTLPIGDMAWIAQGYGPSNVAGQGLCLKLELMTGTIIERKTTTDLQASLFGTRYWEQRLRLQHSGLPQVLFLIEGDLNKDLYNCPADTLLSAVWETRLHLGFSIVQTANMNETVQTLKRMHRRILQRTFPASFYEQELPTFAEAGIRRQRDRLSDEQQTAGRRRRKRLSSLLDMSFDTDPEPALGTERFISYTELKAQVERDREAGTMTVGNIHAAMLKQVSTLSSAKCKSLIQEYPTASTLLRAMHEAPNDAVRKSLVSSMSVGDESINATNRTIGPRSAAEVFVAYGLRQGGDAWSDEEQEQQDSSEPQRASYTELVSNVQNDQKKRARSSVSSSVNSSRSEGIANQPKAAPAARLPTVRENESDNHYSKKAGEAVGTASACVDLTLSPEVNYKPAPIARPTVTAAATAFLSSPWKDSSDDDGLGDLSLPFRQPGASSKTTVRSKIRGDTSSAERLSRAKHHSAIATGNAMPGKESSDEDSVEDAAATFSSKRKASAKHLAKDASDESGLTPKFPERKTKTALDLSMDSENEVPIPNVVPRVARGSKVEPSCSMLTSDSSDDELGQSLAQRVGARLPQSRTTKTMEVIELE